MTAPGAGTRVLVVTQQPLPHEGGLSTHVADLVDGLRARGVEVRLIHGGQAAVPLTGRLLRAATSLGDRDRYAAGNLRAMLSTLARLTGAARAQFRPDLIHSHDALASAAVVAAVGREVPLVQTVHGPALYEARMGGAGGKPRLCELIGRCEASAFAGAARLIAVDSGQARILADDYGVPADRIDVIFNCVDVGKVRLLAAGPPPLAPPRPFFLVPRRLVSKTGVRYAIEALAQLGAGVDLVVAGQGPLAGELQRLARRLGVAGRVHFLGGVPRARLLPLFALARGVIVPSVPSHGVVEATSLAVTEAMACGTAAIATAIGGLAELIEDGRTGLLVPPADPGALAAAMRRVLDDEPLRLRLVRAATEAVERDFSQEAWLDSVLEVYRKAGGRPAAGAGQAP